MIKPLTLPIYMDHNATTKVDPRVFAAMQPFLNDNFGNASSASHAYGWNAQSAVKKARTQVAEFLGCEPKQVIWTSGATESNNLALLGVARFFRSERPHFITQATEHKAVLEVCAAAAEWDADVTVLGVDGDGVIRLDELREAINPRTVLCSIMMANNEVGTLQPIDQIAEICRQYKLILHTDAAQGAGKCRFDLRRVPVDMMSLSGHKIYAPKGVGALILHPQNRDFELKPILFGGEQEFSLRPGTLNVPGIVGFGMACQVAMETMHEECARLCSFQSEILSAITVPYPQVKLNGPRENRLCNNLSLSFPDILPDEIALSLSGVAYSAGSACNSGSAKPSHVLQAMGLPDALSRSTVRLGLGRFTTAQEVQVVVNKILKMLEKCYPKEMNSRTRLL